MFFTFIKKAESPITYDKGQLEFSEYTLYFVVIKKRPIEIKFLFIFSFFITNLNCFSYIFNCFINYISIATFFFLYCTINY